jgi:hypothetical protein
MSDINKLGTQIKLADGRFATVVYNSLIGVGCKLGLHNPPPEDFEGTTGNTVSENMPKDFAWEPDILLRDPWDGCERCGFKPEQCVGEDYEIIKVAP